VSRFETSIEPTLHLPAHRRDPFSLSITVRSIIENPVKFDIETIRRMIRAGKYELTLHARRRMGHRKISVFDMEEALFNGAIIERYSDDRPFPSCLILGYVKDGFPLYVVCAVSDVIQIITVHWLDPEKWLDPKTRREKKHE